MRKARLVCLLATGALAWPAFARASAVVNDVTRINPIGSALHYISQILVSRRGWTHDLSYLASPAVIAIAVTAVVIVAGPRLVRLTAGLR